MSSQMLGEEGHKDPHEGTKEEDKDNGRHNPAETASPSNSVGTLLSLENHKCQHYTCT